ncbi:Hypothetical predicted protein [Olea europaea subsp. europaea]|uniref:Uncharacterized protein n=1 Tax=Olea europaea subsp. europaea TaxID=158383 RepID=A0A8S0V2N6_OLEEU|nr:Hypothetical predicted protein [Olea europaea subsp. europaea]
MKEEKAKRRLSPKSPTLSLQSPTSLPALDDDRQRRNHSHCSSNRPKLSTTSKLSLQSLNLSLQSPTSLPALDDDRQRRNHSHCQSNRPKLSTTSKAVFSLATARETEQRRR